MARQAWIHPNAQIAVKIFLASWTPNSNDSQQGKAVIWDHFLILTEAEIHVQLKILKPWLRASGRDRIRIARSDEGLNRLDF